MNATEIAIIKTLETEGPRSAGQLAELMAEDAETIKAMLTEMLASGAVVKAGAHRYQLPAGHKPISKKQELTEPGDQPETAGLNQATPAPANLATTLVAIKPVSVPVPAPPSAQTVGGMLADLERRLTRKPIANLEEKQSTLLELARITGTGPLRQLLVDIANDLEHVA